MLDEIKQREICAILAVGCSRRVAARYVGCDPGTITNTAEREPEFREALERAESRHEVLNLTSLQAAAREGRYWRAAAWILERRYPHRYAQRKDGWLSSEQVAQLLAQLADVVMAEVPQKYRKRVLERVEKLGVVVGRRPRKKKE